MGPLYFLIISIITPAGELQMTAQSVPSCEGKAEFQELMHNKVMAGDILDWSAICLTVGDKGQAI
jgi:hypothetical protein